MDDDLHPVVKAVMFVLMAGLIILSLWCTIIAFAGGTLPITGWHMDGGLLSGVVWLIIVDPIVLTVGYWLCLVVLLPLGAIFSKS